MKAQILKMSGCKTQKEFYKKYPSEEAFMKVHGKEFKKAQMGVQIEKAQIGWNGVPAGATNYGQPFMGPSTQPEFLKPFIEDTSYEAIEPVGPNLNYGRKQQNANALYQHSNQFDVVGDSLNNSEMRSAKRDIAGKDQSSMPDVGKILGAATGIMDAAGAFKEQRNKLKSLRQQSGVADVSLKAAESIDVDARRQMSENMAKQRQAQMPVNTGEEFFPIYGVGTNVLARNGMMLRGGGEIQNTYAPEYDLYDDGEYEPLNDSDVKQYYYGGDIPQAMNGFSDFMGAGGTDFANKMVGNAFNNNAGSQMGSAVGNAAKMIPGVGPVVGAVAAPVLGAIGGVLDNAFGDAGKIKREQAGLNNTMQRMTNVNMSKALQAQNQSYMRSGGHLRDYTPPSERAMETYEDGGDIQSYGLGGELETHWGGGAETMSYNPYLPGSGETVMFRGKSHEEYSPNGETGIGITYGGNPVEVERGEPMVELEEGGTVDPQTGEVQKSGVVFGNLKIPNQYIDMLGDKNAKGKKFKNYVADLSKIESKQNTIIDKSSKELNALNPINSFDKLKLTALQANIQGANMKLKEIADKKINAASLQNAINDTAEENRLVADDLARGKVKIDKEAMKEYAEYGTSIPKAVDGITTTEDGKKISKAERDRLIKSGEYKVDPSNPKKIKRVNSKSATSEEKKSASAMDNIPVQKLDKNTGFAGGVTKEKFEEFKKRFPDYPGIDKLDPKDPASLNNFKTWANSKAKEIGSTARIKDDPKTENNPQGLPIFGDQFFSFNIEDVKKETPGATESDYLEVEDDDDATTTTEETTKDKFNFMNLLNSAIPYLRPTDAEELDAAQLYPEMYAMATNQVAPVQAQSYQPDLSVPYDISFQDQLNANQADYRAAQRMSGYNPAAQSQLNAQKYQANQSVLANQFRANQEMKNKVYGENRNILNDAKLKNLDIFDRQYGRQSEALSNTKATTQAALNSIADKYAKNKLENRTLQTYENMYNYRFGNNFRAQNMNPLAQFDTDYKGMSSEEIDAMAVLKRAQEKKAKKEKPSTATESIVRNGSIVKSYKNI